MQDKPQPQDPSRVRPPGVILVGRQGARFSAPAGPPSDAERIAVAQDEPHLRAFCRRLRDKRLDD